MSIGISTVIWVLLILIVIYFWRNIVNLIGGLVYLLVIVFIALFLIMNFTDLNIKPPEFYTEIRKGNTDYLVEKKDTAFEKALETKDKINNLDSEVIQEDGVVGDKEDNTGVLITSIEDSQLNFSDESRSDGLEGKDKGKDGDKNEGKGKGKENKATKEPLKEGLIPYEKIPEYVENSDMDESTKKLVLNLSPYVKWEYVSEEYHIESTKEGVLIEEYK